jgi:hypothetical protein
VNINIIFPDDAPKGKKARPWETGGLGGDALGNSAALRTVRKGE